MADRPSLRLSGTLLFVGLVLIIVVGLFHAEGGPANDHVLAFTAYAQSAAWTPVHLGQFIGILITVAGLLALHFALEPASRLQQYAAAAALVALALYGVLQAIDGVTLKQASVAWFMPPRRRRQTRFAAAEAVRWAEWGLRSYFSFVFGLTLILFDSPWRGRSAWRLPSATSWR